MFYNNIKLQPTGVNMPIESSFTPYNSSYSFEEELNRLEKTAKEISQNPKEKFFSLKNNNTVGTAYSIRDKARLSMVEDYARNAYDSWNTVSSKPVRSKHVNNISQNQFLRFCQALNTIQEKQTILPEKMAKWVNSMIGHLTHAYRSEEDKQKTTENKKQKLLTKIKDTGFEPKNKEVVENLSINQLKDLKKLTRLRAAKKKGSEAYKKFDKEIKKLLRNEAYEIKQEPKVELNLHLKVKTSEGILTFPTNMYTRSGGKGQVLMRRSGEFGDRSVNEQVREMGIVNKGIEVSELDKQLNHFSEVCSNLLWDNLAQNLYFPDENGESMVEPSTNLPIPMDNNHPHFKFFYSEYKNLQYAFDVTMEKLAPKYFDENGKFRTDQVIEPEKTEEEESDKTPLLERKEDEEAKSLYGDISGSFTYSLDQVEDLYKGIEGIGNLQSSTESVEEKPKLSKEEIRNLNSLNFLADFKKALKSELTTPRGTKEDIEGIPNEYTSNLVTEPFLDQAGKFFNLVLDKQGQYTGNDKVYKKIFKSAG